jgi:hypothetical protein
MALFLPGEKFFPFDWGVENVWIYRVRSAVVARAVNNSSRQQPKRISANGV